MSDYISVDNLVLILKYLPVKTLLKFRCVCKEWKQLIDSPSFAQKHISVQNPRFLVEYEGRKYLVVDSRPRPFIETLKKPVDNDHFSIVGTLHGVVCLFDIGNFVIWNPSIRKLSSIPLPLGVKWSPCHAKHNCCGFWIDPSSREFKIIIVKRNPREPVVNCDLYSSIRGGWSVIPSTGKLENWKSCKQGPPVMIGGVAHWGGCLDESMDECDWEHDHDDKVVLCFDFVRESFDVIKTPDGLHSKIAPCRWQGVLSLVCWDEDFPRGCKIYLRQDGSWVKKISFKVYESIQHVFWAMEDVEERKKRGKRKRVMEERMSASMGGKEENVRVVATIISDSSTMEGELVFDGPKTGCKTLRKGLERFDRVSIVYDFVESLLFP